VTVSPTPAILHQADACSRFTTVANVSVLPTSQPVLAFSAVAVSAALCVLNPTAVAQLP